MPAVISTLQPPDSNVTLLAPKHQGRLVSRTYLFALAALVALLVLRFAAPRLLLPGWTWLKGRGRRDRRKDYRRDILARPSGSATTVPGGTSPAQGRKHRQPIWTADSAMEKSRAVSTDGADDISQQLPGGPAAGVELRRPSPPSALLGSPDGVETEKLTMDGATWSGTHAGTSSEDGTSFGSSSSGGGGGGTVVLDYAATSRHFMMRPPPPPPLTPPTLSSAVFAFEERRPSYAVSIPAELDTVSPVSFIHQPNPDYMAASATSSADVASSSPSTPRRRSYTKTLPIGIPTAALPSSPPSPDAAFSATKDAAAFSPSSYPSASPLLPPPPPGHHEAMYDDGLDGSREIDVQGEIISVLDDSGAGWKRHTRVYGGGVCLACMASEGGGFYGDKVPPEHRR